MDYKGMSPLKLTSEVSALYWSTVKFKRLPRHYATKCNNNTDRIVTKDLKSGGERKVRDRV